MSETGDDSIFARSGRGRKCSVWTQELACLGRQRHLGSTWRTESIHHAPTQRATDGRRGETKPSRWVRA